MSANVLSFTPAQFAQEAVVVSNGDHRAAIAAARTDRRAQEIERLPFDLSAIEMEGVFINIERGSFMIANEREYRITKASVKKFERALKSFDEGPAERPVPHPRLIKAEKEGIACIS